MRRVPVPTHRRLTILAVSTGLLVLAGSGRAEPPCLADVKKFCADTPVGSGKIQACLKAHEADLSPACKKGLADIGKRVGPFVATCRYDIVQFCADEPPGSGRVGSCLQKHRDELSPECKDRVDQVNKPDAPAGAKP